MRDIKVTLESGARLLDGRLKRKDLYQASSAITAATTRTYGASECEPLPSAPALGDCRHRMRDEPRLNFWSVILQCDA
jgi:hypothetical protein